MDQRRELRRRECGIVEEQPAVPAIEVVVMHAVCCCTVGKHNAFRLARRAAGVYDVRLVVSADCHLPIVAIVHTLRLAARSQQNVHLNCICKEPGIIFIGNDDFGVRGGDNLCISLGRTVRIKHRVCGSRLQDGQQSDDQVDGAIHADGHDVTFVDWQSPR